MKLILFFCYVVGGASFLVGRQHYAPPFQGRPAATTRLRQGKNSWNPFKEVSDMMNNLFSDLATLCEVVVNESNGTRAHAVVAVRFSSTSVLDR